MSVLKEVFNHLVLPLFPERALEFMRRGFRSSLERDVARASDQKTEGRRVGVTGCTEVCEVAAEAVTRPSVPAQVRR